MGNIDFSKQSGHHMPTIISQVSNNINYPHSCNTFFDCILVQN